MTRDGDRTGEFGLWLTNALKDKPQYQVYYDHGDPRKHSNVKVIKGFLGEQVRRDNKLADIDVLVADQKNNILLLIEIEESPISPKTLLGDVFASLFSTNFAVNVDGKQVYFHSTQKTKLLVAGYISRFSSDHSNSIHDIRSRLEKFRGPENSISLARVEFLIGRDLESCLEQLADEVLGFLCA